jgi:CRISPR-associated protein Csm1
LYGIVELLRQDEPGRINIARLAYLLARREPGKDASPELKQIYADFARNIYQWALNEEDRKQLLTALVLYTYNNREAKEESRNGG